MFQEPIHVERQNFSGWVYALLLVMGVGGLFLALPDPSGNVVPVRLFPGFVLVSLSAIALNLLCMTVRVMRDEVSIHFGRSIYFYTAHIGLDDIRRVECIAYRPIRESGGWGIRWGTHEGRKARYFSASGDKAVLVETDKRLIILGSSNPEKLAAAIESARGASRGM